MSVATLPAAVLGWVVDQVAPGGRVSAARRLTGGVTSTVHRLTVQTPAGSRTGVVLRRWTGAALSAEGNDPADDSGPDNVGKEAAVLASLAAFPLAPRLMGVDPTGQSCGSPALLMSALPGRLHLTPADPRSWVQHLAGTLVEIHALTIPAPPYESWLDPELLVVPEWTGRPELWRTAFRRYAEGPPPAAEGFLHHDYQQFNVLWTGERVSGVVDWVWASTGPQDVDVAHCRLNLTLLYSSERAEQFRLAYESAAGRATNPWWDLAGQLGYLPGWGKFLQRQAGRRLRLDFAGMPGRVEQTLAGILRRL